MNESGKYIKQKVSGLGFRISDLVVVHDDLDIPLGKFKIQLGVGPKVHNGVESVERELGTKDFWRVRIGVDNRDPEARIPGDEYVLQDFTKEEMKVLENVFPQIGEQMGDKISNPVTQ